MGAFDSEAQAIDSSISNLESDVQATLDATDDGAYFSTLWDTDFFMQKGLDKVYAGGWDELVKGAKNKMVMGINVDVFCSKKAEGVKGNKITITKHDLKKVDKDAWTVIVGGKIDVIFGDKHDTLDGDKYEKKAVVTLAYGKAVKDDERKDRELCKAAVRKAMGDMLKQQQETYRETARTMTETFKEELELEIGHLTKVVEKELKIEIKNLEEEVKGLKKTQTETFDLKTEDLRISSKGTIDISAKQSSIKVETGEIGLSHSSGTGMKVKSGKKLVIASSLMKLM